MRSSSQPVPTYKAFSLLGLFMVCSAVAEAQLYVDGTLLFIGNNASLFVDDSFQTAKSSTVPPRVANRGTITLTRNTNFHNDTEYLGVGEVVMEGTNTQTITSNSIPIRKLKIDNSANVKLAGNVSLSGDLTLTEGFLVLGNHDLTLDDSVNITGGSSSSYIRINGTGKVKTVVSTTPKLLPIGRNPYLPVTIDDGGGAEYSVGLAEDVYADPEMQTTLQTSNVVGETWTLQASSAQNNVSVTLQWESAEEETGFNRSAAYLSYWEEGVSTSWDVGTSQSASGSGPYTLTRTVNLSTQLYYFGVGSSGSALPVELNHFSVNWSKSGRSADLHWETQSELNNSHFEIERSLDAQHWEPIGRVEGNGTSASGHSYHFMDQNLPSGTASTSYYRLKQVDYDGAFAYSPVLTLSQDHQQSEPAFQLYPNPATHHLWLSTTGDYTITSIDGKSTWFYPETAQIDLSQLAAGVYLIRNQEGALQRFVKG